MDDRFGRTLRSRSTSRQERAGAVSCLLVDLLTFTMVPHTAPDDTPTRARRILAEAVVIDTLGGAVVQPTPYVADGTYGEAMVRNGWNVLHACLVSEPSYSPSFHRLLMAVYENLLNFEMSGDVRHVETVGDILDA